jgi:hypothetical protein
MSLEKLVRLRDAVRPKPSTEPTLAAYLEKVSDRAWEITDDDVRGVLAAGHSEDDVFEATITTALDAAIARYEAGLRALDEADR